MQYYTLNVLELVYQYMCSQNDVSWGITLHISLPHAQSFFTLQLQTSIKPKFKLLGLKIFKYVKYFNEFQCFDFKFNYLKY